MLYVHLEKQKADALTYQRILISADLLSVFQFCNGNLSVQPFVNIIHISQETNLKILQHFEKKKLLISLRPRKQNDKIMQKYTTNINYTKSVLSVTKMSAFAKSIHLKNDIIIDKFWPNFRFDRPSLFSSPETNIISVFHEKKHFAL